MNDLTSSRETKSRLFSVSTDVSNFNKHLRYR